MNKKYFVAMVLFSIPLAFLSAKKEITNEDLGPENSWQKQFDIESKKTGKYNIIVTAEDQAGNEVTTGPYNIYIDPESDLPVTRITNPVENMIVPGNLNIVGTCIDDDLDRMSRNDRKLYPEVFLILDGDEENPVKAEGTEFWSYYLDTTKLSEGAHTVEVYGIEYTDKDGKVDKENPKIGRRSKVTWQLNRHAPEIVVTKPEKMGELVSGKFRIEGMVTDGNGIKSLEYSMDDSVVRHYLPVKIKEEKLKEKREDGVSSVFNYSVTIDSRDFKDGATTCWFKATDYAGSTKEEAFLFLIDNTKPDVRILTPAKDEVKNGIFTVAGYAKDTIGVSSLKWIWGSESGEFELTPGNPYWVKEVDSRGKNKSEKFTIIATDTIGNMVTVSRDIPLNQEQDKPVVKIMSPADGSNVEGEEGFLFIRGIASDDDGVVSVTYSVDGGEEHTIDCTGVFSEAISGALSNGSHTITAYATDKYGLKGNKVTSTFKSNGTAPIFDRANFVSGKKSTPFIQGMQINPEAKGNFEVKVSSSTGLKSVEYEVTWGTNEKIPGQLNLQGGEKSASVVIPLYGENFPWGIAKINIKASDIFDRVSYNNSIVWIKDLTQINPLEPGVYFTDSNVSEDGLVEAGTEQPLTGYFAGAGKISSVSIVPAARGVSASFEDHMITVKSSSASDRFKVRVTTTAGAVFDSQELKFFVNAKPPKVTLNADKSYNTEKEIPFEFLTAKDVLKISGNVSSSNSVTLKYRIHSVAATVNDLGIVTSVASPEASDYVDLTVDRRGNFSIKDMGLEEFSDGVSVVEIVATDGAGKVGSNAVFVRKLPFDPGTVTDASGKNVSKIEPKVFWIRGAQDYFGVCVYQGTTDNTVRYVSQDSITSSNTKLTFTVTPTDAVSSKGKVQSYSTDITVSTKSEIRAWFSSVDDIDYRSGMAIVIDNGTTKESGHYARVHIKSTEKIKQVAYSIKGENAPGGKNNQTGMATLRAITEGEEYEADIPLADLPARVTDLIATVTDEKGSSFEARGTIAVLRNHAVIDNSSKIYWAPLGNVVYDAEQSAYILNNGQTLSALANIMRGTLKAEVRGATTRGLSVEYDDFNILHLKAESDGIFRGVSIRVTDEKGVAYNSPEVNLIVDTSAPEVKLSTPSNMGFVKNRLNINGTVTDGNGVTSLEYCMLDKRAAQYDKAGALLDDGEVEWKPVTYTRAGAFSFTVDLTEYPDGYIPLSFRAVDSSKKVSLFNTVYQKDVTAPEVKVLLPDAETVINGENTIVFDIKEEGLLTNIAYSSADGKTRQDYKIFKTAIPADDEEKSVTLKSLNSSMANARIGTVEMPISQRMTYTFTDGAGNTTTLNSWEFIVDEKKDKPVAEIHLPKYQKEDAENGLAESIQVITTDFKISGVLFDDDGPCKVYYRIDSNPYKVVDAENLSFNYEISVPLESMTDNEHTVSVYAEDINGVRGDEVRAKFRISLEEPKGGFTAPEISTTVKETVVVKGWASDKNGVSKVQVSIDNGASFNDAVGTTEWSYSFDTRVVQDGTHVVFIKIYDGYNITGLYSSLINIDNTAPELRLELPLDDSKTTKNIFFSGQTTDNIGLTSLYITIRSLENRTVPDRLARRNLEPAEIISQALDISELNNGFYNIELTGTDAAGNVTRVSRNIQLNKNVVLSKVDLLYPLNGEHLNGEFNIYGTASSEKEDPIQKVELLIDGKKADYLEPVAVNASGYFNFRIKREMGNPETTEGVVRLAEGKHTYKAKATTLAGKEIVSIEHSFIYNPYGPWVTLDNFSYGDFAMNRPLLKGKAGYNLTDEEKEELKYAKKLTSERRIELEGKKIKQVFISFDNGKTYEPVSKQDKGEWKYRVENLDIAPGYHFMLIKAEMYNGENAITRTIVQVDRTAPTIRLISPGEGGRYNQVLEFDGLTSDDVELKNVRLSLRSGDKASYELPGFIQGLYFDVSVWGATLYNIGVGITAFDSAVKIQANFGQFTQEQRDIVSGVLQQSKTDLRFGGNVFGGKIIAQLVYLPFRYFFGRDWDWLSATFSVGANFSYFTDTGAATETGEKVPQVLSAVLAQIEFPRITIANQKFFRTWSTYVEPQVWFIPSDIASDDAKKYVFTMSLGLRTSVF